MSGDAGIDGWLAPVQRMLTRWPPWLVRAMIVALALAPLIGMGAWALLDAPATSPIDRQQALESEDIYVDSDGDGLSDLLENYVYGTDPNETRTASTVVPDGYLARHGYDPANPSAEERWAAYPGPSETPPAWGEAPLPPSHRVTVREVYAYERPANWSETEQGPWDGGLDPRTWQTPSQIPMPWLLTYDLDPRDPDVGERVLAPLPEGDGLTVEQSYRTATDPRATDTDGDGLADHVEIDETGTDPAAFATAGAGMADGWAVEHGLDVHADGIAHTDLDRDGLTNAEEFNASVRLVGRDAAIDGSGLDPQRRSTAGTPIPDGWLVDEGLDPLDPGVHEGELGCASDYGQARDLDVLDDVCLTVLDAYTYERPARWDESEDGPWTGGLSAATNDTDGDGLPDAVELRGWFVNITTSTAADATGEETFVESDPISADTDRDGLTDLEEHLGATRAHDVSITFPATDPQNADTDFDGLSDGEEILVASSKLAEHLGEARALDPVDRDTDGDGFEDGREWSRFRARAEACRGGGAPYGFTNPTQDTREVLTRIAQATGAQTPGGVCTLLEPWGDPDADGDPNILDDDSDDDGLLDGWEEDPRLYQQSPYASEHSRSRTDAINPDTDGDTLPDAWEVQHGEFDRELDGFNLDPSKWSSFSDDTSDAERDLDDDGITWYSFHRSPQGIERREHTFTATNRVEHLNGTDPNTASTPDNGLKDGWTIFWGSVYPELPTGQLGDVYPGAPGPLIIPSTVDRPSPSIQELETTSTASIVRFDTTSQTRSGETLVAVFQDIPGPDGTPTDVFRFDKRLELTFLDHQAHRTNPYLEDTDGDGAPDAYEIGHNDPRTQHPSPVIPQAGEDPDGDGLHLADEATLGTDPNEADTDLGGATDGDEASGQLNPLDPTDDQAGANADSDCDGRTDREEARGWEHPTEGTVRTSVTRPDGDLDGLADGFDLVLDPEDAGEAACIQALRDAHILERDEPDGRVRFLGEASREGDPNAWSTVGDGVPDGYRALWSIDATEQRAGLEDAYTYGKPTWWDEATMGPWLWGQRPQPNSDLDDDGSPDTRASGDELIYLDTDLDQDGLDDRNGEDPTPGARPELSPPNGWPDAAGLSTDERRHRAATFGIPPDQRVHAGARDIDDDGVLDPEDRVQAHVQGLDLTEVDGEQDPPSLRARTPYTLTGQVLVEDRSGTPHGVPSATVVVEINDARHPVGAGFTNLDGRFEIPFELAPEHQVTVPEGIALMGRTAATVGWSVNLTGVPLGQGPADDPNRLTVRVYNTSGAAQPGDPTYLDVPARLQTPDGSTVETTAQGIRATRSDPIPFRLTTDAELTIEAPTETAPATQVPVTVTLQRATGGPLIDRELTLTTPSTTQTLTTDGRGQAELTLDVTDGPPREITISATYEGTDAIRGDAAQVSLLVKRPTTLAITGAEPTPAIAGRNVTLTGNLEGPLDPSGVDIEVTAAGTMTGVATGPGGSFTTTIPVPADPGGALPIELRYGGNRTLLGAQAETRLPVVAGAHIALHVPTEPVHPGEAIPTEARLLTATGSPIPDAQVHLEGPPGSSPRTLVAGPDGRVETSWNATNELGTHRLTARFDGADAFTPTTTRAFVTVASPTTLTLEPPGTLTRSAPAELAGTLATPGGDPVPGQPVNITLAGSEIGRVVSKDNGAFTYAFTLPDDVPLGPATLTATFDGSLDDRYEASRASTQATITQGLSLDPLHPELRRGTNVIDLDVALDDGRPLPQGQLELAIPALGHTSATTIDGTRTTLRVPVPADTPLGPLDARYRYTTPELPTITVDTTLPVVSATTIDLTLPTSAARGDTIQIHGTVTDDRGRAVPAGSVNLTLFGPVRELALTDGSFDARVDIPADLPPATYEATVRYEGHGPYEATTEHPVLRVRQGVSIELALEDPQAGDQLVRGQVRVLDDTGEPLPGQEVLLRSPGNASYLVRTGPDGSADLVLRAEDADAATYEVLFPGSDTYAAATSSATATPAQPGVPGSSTAWGLAALASFVLLAGLSLAVWRYRQSAREQAARALETGGRELMAGNEYEATVHAVYRALIVLVSEQGAEPAEQETLGEFRQRLTRTLGLDGQAIDELFTVFDDTFYGPAAPGPSQRTRAIQAFQDVAERIRSLRSTPEPSTRPGGMP